MKRRSRNTQRGKKPSVSPSVHRLLKTNSALQTLQRLQGYSQSGAGLGIHYQRNLMMKCCVIASVPMEPDAHSLFPDLKIVVNKHSYQMNHVKTRVAGYNLLPVAQTSRNWSNLHPANTQSWFLSTNKIVLPITSFKSISYSFFNLF